MLAETTKAAKAMPPQSPIVSDILPAALVSRL